MTWTTEQPTRKGYYWCSVGGWVIDVADVVWDRDHVRFIYYTPGDPDPRPVSVCKWLSSEPLELPWIPKERDDEETEV
jgi:hypothetical protein